MMSILLIVALMIPATIVLEWLIVFIMTKSGLAFKLLPKPDPKKFYVNYNSDGVQFNLPGADPLDAINNLIKKVTGADQPIDKKIDKVIDGYINEKIKDSLVNELSKKDNPTDSIIQEYIRKAIEKKIGNLGKDENNGNK